MKRLRSPAVAGFFFCLISLGQAYPLSLAWGISRSAHSCCCSGVQEPCHCAHESSRFHCHQGRSPGYAPAPCGGKTQEVMTFHWDPFLLNQNIFVVADARAGSFVPLSQWCDKIEFAPESPPPKA